MTNKPFSPTDIRDDHLEGTSCFFAHDLRDEFPDLFNHCENNGHVEEDLKNAGVVRKSDKCQSGGLFRVTFKTRKQGEAFIIRLNNYISRLSEFSE